MLNLRDRMMAYDSAVAGVARHAGDVVDIGQDSSGGASAVDGVGSNGDEDSMAADVPARVKRHRDDEGAALSGEESLGRRAAKRGR